MTSKFGLKALVERAGGYRLIQHSVGSHRLWRWFVDAHILPHQPTHILDLGCGTADILDFLPSDINYTGVDQHAPYIENARHRHGTRAHFQCQPITQAKIEQEGGFDMVLLLGVLHHCSKAESEVILHEAVQHLSEGGVVIHLDGCLHAGADWLETMLYRLERGLYVRNQQEYAALMDTFFQTTTQDIQDHKLRVPYRYCVGTGR